MCVINSQTVLEHGLTQEEYGRVLDILGREPNLTELGVFSVMWSEHCSYKSSKTWLKKLPTEAPWVICGPGENAGVIDIGEGKACIFKMESHNHPSFIEPFQGAATGVGGILRDVFTMGARPVATLNALRFGSTKHSKTRHLVNGVVAGIGHYGNSVGIPTVGGEVNFDPAYNGNILVNAMAVGIANIDRIFYSAATGIGNLIVYVGSKTGRDGIHGATMASSEFTDDSEVKRPTVQVGDPFTEKLLMEACLELMETNSIVAIQDMGAAGLTSSSVEMSNKGGVGIELNLDEVPTREPRMTPYEIMLSESQERMLIVLNPKNEVSARLIFEKWGLDFSVIGTTTEKQRLVLNSKGKIVCDIPVQPLVMDAPVYHRPWLKTLPAKEIDPKPVMAKTNLRPLEALQELISSPNLCSRRWIWEQFDYMVMGDTVNPPGGDAAVIRVHGSNRGIAITTDCSPRYCLADPIEGGKQAVAETWRNLTAVGATPLAITDNLNFGNPERPEIMGQFVGCIEGMSEACKILEFPVVSGNVSLYNETNGNSILPTPAIGGVGLIEDIRTQMTSSSFTIPGQNIILIGDQGGSMGQSLLMNLLSGKMEGKPPQINLMSERRNGDFVRGLIKSSLVSACHDVSDGGLLVSIAEMIICGKTGAHLTIRNKDIPILTWYFSEDQSRYVLASDNADKVLSLAQAAEVNATIIGITGSNELTLDEGEAISKDELTAAHESWFPNYMNPNGEQ